MILFVYFNLIQLIYFIIVWICFVVLQMDFWDLFLFKHSTKIVNIRVFKVKFLGLLGYFFQHNFSIIALYITQNESSWILKIAAPRGYFRTFFGNFVPHNSPIFQGNRKMTKFRRSLFSRFHRLFHAKHSLIQNSFKLVITFYPTRFDGYNVEEKRWKQWKKFIITQLEDHLMQNTSTKSCSISWIDFNAIVHTSFIFPTFFFLV